MSDVLTPDALGTEAAVPEAPATPAAVEGVSADGEAPKVVPAERFNGLQSKYQSEKSEWEREREAMLAQLESLRRTEETVPVENPDVTELVQEVQALRGLLVEERQTSVREKVLKDFPDAAPFADMLIGDDEAQLRAVAAQVAERVALLKGGSTEPEPTTDPVPDEPQVTADSGTPAADTPPAVPESSGSVPVTGAETLADRKAAAVASKNFLDFFHAAQEEAMLAISRQVVA